MPSQLVRLYLSLAGAGTSIISVAPKVYLLRQNLCRDKNYVCRDKHNFVARKKKKLLSRQTCFCCDRSFVTTKMILVATPANDIYQGEECPDSQHNLDKRNEVKIRNKNAGAGSGWGGRGGGGGGKWG